MPPASPVDPPLPIVPPSVMVDGWTAGVLAALLPSAEMVGARLDALGIRGERRYHALRVLEAMNELHRRWQAASAGGSPAGRAVGAPAPSEQLDTAGAARMLDLSPRRVRQLAADGTIGRRVAGRWVFGKAELTDFIDGRPGAGSSFAASHPWGADSGGLRAGHPPTGGPA